MFKIDNKKIFYITVGLIVALFPLVYWFVYSFLYSDTSKNANDEYMTVLNSNDENMTVLNSNDENMTVLNSREDINQDLLDHIVNNDLQGLIINYPFTSCDIDAKFNYMNNPFQRANAKKPVRRIDFEIRFGPNVNSLDCAFEGLKILEYVNIKDVSNITSMKRVFSNAQAFNQPIGNWDTSNVTNMSCMFKDAKKFNQPIGNWDTSKVTDMSCMFMGAKVFNQPIGKWDVSNVTNIASIFKEAVAFDQDLSRWDTSNVENLRMSFWGAKSFNRDISMWKLPKIRSRDSVSGVFGNGCPYSFSSPSTLYELD